MLVTRLLSAKNVCIQKGRCAKPQVVHVDKMKPCRGVTPTSWLDQEPDSSYDDGAVEDPGLPARLRGDLTDGIDGTSLFELPIGDLENFPDTGGKHVDEHPAMSADARPPEILVDACDDPTVLDEAEPPGAGNRVPEGGDAAVADGDSAVVVVRKPGTTGGQPCGRPDDWPNRSKRDSGLRVVSKTT